VEAAKQCGRGIIPTVSAPTGFSEALRAATAAELPLFCYEGEGTEPLPRVLRRVRASLGRIPKTVSIMVGSEGGFSQREAERARESGMIPVGLGKRILRTETAASFVLSCLAYEFELS
ncbi:MAG: RNA methyltransferase, partial [Ruminococcaceae bacterium]|nr:RNA methyltransferase [Oscillospiraceae bacterium]